MTANVLEVDNISAGYGESTIIRDLSFSVAAGEVLALLGPNGAGKTTTLRAITNIVAPSRGDVRVQGASVVRLPTHRLTQLGVGHVPEGRGVFASMTVAEHLRLADTTIDKVGELFPELAPLRSRRAGLLSGGEQQMLALACVLVRDPSVLLIDELSLGLAPVIVERLLPIIKAHAEHSHAAVILVEQHVNLALGIADRGIVLSHGEIALERPAAELRNNWAALMASYMGDRPQTVPSTESN